MDESTQAVDPVAAPPGESGMVGGGVASGRTGAPMAAQPPFALQSRSRDDLSTAPIDYWHKLDTGFQQDAISVDDYYAQHRQLTLDTENPMLRSLRDQFKIVPPTEPGGALEVYLSTSQSAQPTSPHVPATSPSGGGGSGFPTTPAPAQHPLALALSSIGLRGWEPLQPARSLVETLYADNPSKDTNPVYRTASRLATVLDTALTAANVPITGIGDLANLALAPLTVGLKAAGADKATIEGFIQGTRVIPELAAAFGTGQGLLGAAGKVGNLTGLAAELAPLMARAGRVAKLEDSFAATMRDVWQSERGGVRMPGPPGEPPINPEILAADTPETLARKYEAAVITARRGGPRTLEQVTAEGQALIDEGLMSMDTIRQMTPGTVLNDAQTWAMMRVLADEGLRLTVLARRALETQNPADVQHMLEQFWTFALAHHPPGIGAEAEAGRSLHVWNDPTSGLKQFLTQFETLARNSTTGFDGMTVARAIAEFRQPGQLSVFARQALKPGFWDLFNEYFVNGMLWGPKTWAANFMGNTVTTLWSVPERKVAEWIGSGQGVQAGEAWELMQGMFGSQLDAFRVGALALREDESQLARIPGMEALGKTELARRRAISSEALELTGGAGRVVDLIGNVIRVPGNVLSSTDDYFKVINWRAQQRALALREARQEAMAHGLEGRDFAEFVDQRINDKMADPPMSITKEADRYALYQTFQQELGRAGKLLSQLSNLPAGKILLPIIRTPINISKWVGERTPLMLLNKRFWREISGSDKAVGDLALAKVTLGSMALGIGAFWYMSGHLTGGGPTDPKVRKNLTDNLGWQAYSARIGDKLVGLSRMEPPGLILGLGADFAEAMLNAGEDGDVPDADEAANAAGVAIASAIKNRTMIKGLAETFGAIADPQRMMAARLSSFLISMVPLSGLVRQSEQVIDPALREAQGVMERFRSQVPGLSSTLAARRDLNGDPVFLTGVWGPVGISTLKDDPVALERHKVGARIPDIARAVGPKGNRIELTPAEREYWAIQRGKLEMRGQTVQERQAETMRSSFYQNASKDAKAALLERDIRAYHAEAFKETLKHYPNLDKSIREAQKKALADWTKGPSPESTTPLLKSLTR
jgi:hypothetical protein